MGATTSSGCASPMPGCSPISHGAAAPSPQPPAPEQLSLVSISWNCHFGTLPAVDNFHPERLLLAVAHSKVAVPNSVSVDHQQRTKRSLANCSSGRRVAGDAPTLSSPLFAPHAGRPARSRHPTCSSAIAEAVAMVAMAGMVIAVLVAAGISGFTAASHNRVAVPADGSFHPGAAPRRDAGAAGLDRLTPRNAAAVSVLKSAWGSHIVRLRALVSLNFMMILYACHHECGAPAAKSVMAQARAAGTHEVAPFPYFNYVERPDVLAISREKCLIGKEEHAVAQVRIEVSDQVL